MTDIFLRIPSTWSYIHKYWLGIDILSFPSAQLELLPSLSIKSLDLTLQAVLCERGYF